MIKKEGENSLSHFRTSLDAYDKFRWYAHIFSKVEIYLGSIGKYLEVAIKYRYLSMVLVHLKY